MISKYFHENSNIKHGLILIVDQRIPLFDLSNDWIDLVNIWFYQLWLLLLIIFQEIIIINNEDKVINLKFSLNASAVWVDHILLFLFKI